MKDLQAKWDEIVRMTEDLDGVLQGLRNELFLDINRKKITNKENFIILLNLIRLLIYKKKYYKIKNSRVILFYFPYSTPAKLGNLNPIYQLFNHKEKIIQVICTRNINVKLFDNNYLFKEDLFKIVCHSKRLRLLLKSIKKYKTLVQSTSLNHIVKNKKIKYYYLIFKILLYKESIRKLFSDSNIKILISTSDFFPVDYALFSIANELNIKTYLLQHGILGISHFPCTAKNIFVWGPIFKDELIKKGGNDSNIICSGMPLMDNIFKRLVTKNEVNKLKKKKRYKLLILSDTQGKILYPNIYKKYYLFLEKLINSNLNIEIIVKLHPAEDSSFYSNFLNYIKLLPKKTTLMEALSICDLAATIWSAAGLEAMVYGKPTLVFKVDEFVSEYAWWPLKGGGKYIVDIDELEKTLEVEELNSIIERQYSFIKNSFSNLGFSADFIKGIIWGNI